MSSLLTIRVYALTNGPKLDHVYSGLRKLCKFDRHGLRDSVPHVEKDVHTMSFSGLHYSVINYLGIAHSYKAGE